MRIAIERSESGSRELVIHRGGPVMRTAPDTDTGIWPAVSSFWDELRGTAFSPRMIDLVWVADRCIQLNAQQISSMPLRFQGAFANSVEPSWLSNPDPIWYPNGISDAVFSLVDSYYRHGDALLYITAWYASGFPSAWTVLDATQTSVRAEGGRRAYKIGQVELDPSRVVQISRNPRGQLRGTSALRAYAQTMSTALVGGLAASDALANNPPAVLKAQTKKTKDQAEAIQDQWMDRIDRRRRGVPPVLPPDIDLVGTNLGFAPKDLLLIEAQEFNARVLASSCGVPVFLLNLVLTGGLVYQNPAMLGEFWWRTELRPSSRRIAEAFTANMLPRGNSVVFDAADLVLPLDQQAITDDSVVADASPADQGNVAEIRPLMTEVG